MTTDREALVKLLREALPAVVHVQTLLYFNAHEPEDSPEIGAYKNLQLRIEATLTAQGGEQTADTVNVSRELLEQLRQSHEECDDCWYSCPKSGDCCNEFAGDECTCGADYFNAKIDAMLAAAKEGKS